MDKYGPVGGSPNNGRNQNGLLQFALNMIERNPNIQNNPNAKSMIEVLRSGDTSRGEQMASNICDSMGVSREDAISQARGFFGI